MLKSIRLSLFTAALVAASNSVAQDVVNAEDHSCGELAGKVAAAGELAIRGRHHNPNASERVGINVYVPNAGRDSWVCEFFDERPSQWRIYAKGGEICRNLHICLPASFGGPTN